MQFQVVPFFTDLLLRAYEEYTIHAWGGVTRMVEQFIDVLLIHIKHVLSTYAYIAGNNSDLGKLYVPFIGDPLVAM